MCDFSYSINNGEDPEDIKVNSFLFDEGSGTKAKATTGIEMALGTVQFAQTYCGSAAGDKDLDGFKDSVDNCPTTYNPDQKDTDGDGVGDVCDNCKYPNPLQVDADHDGMGDGDKAGDLSCDNCKLNANFDQSDVDNDGIGDVCDNCSTISNADQTDANKNGIGDVCEGLDQGAGTVALVGTFKEYYRYVGDKRYELSNHLGNVLSVISDRSLADENGGLNPDVFSYSDYYPFGMLVPNPNRTASKYRYGFQGQEKDDEIKGGEGNSLNYTFRMHDPRVGRFFATDPLEAKYPWNSPYAFSENNVMDGIELEGAEKLSFKVHMAMQTGNPALGVVTFVDDWYSDKAESKVNALGRGLDKVAKAIAPIRPMTKEESKAVEDAGGSFQHLKNTIKDLPNIPSHLYDAGVGYVNTMNNGSTEDKIESTTVMIGIIASAIKGKSPSNLGSVARASLEFSNKGLNAIEFALRGSVQKALGNAKGVYKFVMTDGTVYIGQAQGVKGFAQRVKRSLTELVEGTTSKAAKAPGKVLDKVEFHEFNPATDANVNALETRLIKESGGVGSDKVLNQRGAPSTPGKN